MRKLVTLFAALMLSVGLLAQAPANNSGVMLQAFYSDSYNVSYATTANGASYGTTKWTDISSQAEEIAETFDFVWFAPSAKSDGNYYHPKQWSNQNTDWGTKVQLKNAITALKTYNSSVKVIADIVINHKSGNGVLDLDNENFGSFGSFTLYESGNQSKYVCQDDEAAKQGYKCLGAKDAGYVTECEASGGYCDARDLDHSNSYLRDAIKAYLKWMKSEIGYDGWRYDYVQGYLGKYIKEYNQAAGGSFSVGDFKGADYTTLAYWLVETGKTTNAFDYALKSIALNDGLVNKDYAKMVGTGAGAGLVGDNSFKQYAVSFVDNHDSFIDDDTKFKGDWAQANAYIIAMPGTPCVFYPHWVQCKEDIQKMIVVRKACGITNTSTAACSSTNSYFKGEITGTNGNLVVYIGDKGTCPAGYHLACSGDGWIYYTNLPGTASITADVEKIEFEQKTLEGTVTDEKEITITGESLTDPIIAEMKGKSIFSVTGTFSKEGGTMTVSYETKEVGDYKDTIILTSSDASLEIPVRVSIVAPAPELSAPQVPTVSEGNVQAISCDKYDSDLGWYPQGWGGCNWVDTCKAGVNMFYAKTMHWDCFASDWVGAGVADYTNLHFDIWFEADGNCPIIKLEFVDELATEEFTIPGEYKVGWNSVNINIKDVFGEQPMDNLKCLTVKVAKEGGAVAWANIMFFNGDYTSQVATGYCGDAPAECKYTEYENWQIKSEGSEWSDNLVKVEDGLFKLVEFNWTGSGFNVKSDENPIKQDWFPVEELVIGEDVIAPVIVDVYLKVIDDETLAIEVRPVPTDAINIINAEDVPNGAIIKDGKVYIIRGGKVYNLQGSEIKNADDILKSVQY